ncbi:MAG: sigma-70 family RNA polymerase sigma factor [Planctomycetes bacterium]|nr:sigma-70 family RNA polymerase sigma factor [Planctomycetota bacterium]
MHDNNDSVLLQRFAEGGDAQAFSELVGRHQNFVYGACLRVLDNTADAEDVSQECFLRLARRAGAVRSSVVGWLHHNATAMSIDAKRQQAARRRREQVHNEMKASNNNDGTWQEIAPHVDKAVDELPDELRAVLIDYFLRRRTQADIAAELGVSQGTVSRRVDAGIDELRKKLKKAGLIVSSALLASLITEHAACAAPAALTAALGKIAMAGAVKTGAATGTAAGWTGAGVAAGAMTTIAKIKIAAVVVAALAVGGVVVQKMAGEGGNAPEVTAERVEEEIAEGSSENEPDIPEPEAHRPIVKSDPKSEAAAAPDDSPTGGARERVWIELSGRVVDDETGEPIEQYWLQRGWPSAKEPSKIAWSGAEYWSRRRNDRFSWRTRERIGTTRCLRVLADGYLPEPVTAHSYNS